MEVVILVIIIFSFLVWKQPAASGPAALLMGIIVMHLYGYNISITHNSYDRCRCQKKEHEENTEKFTQAPGPTENLVQDVQEQEEEEEEEEGVVTQSENENEQNVYWTTSIVPGHQRPAAKQMAIRTRGPLAASTPSQTTTTSPGCRQHVRPQSRSISGEANARTPRRERTRY